MKQFKILFITLTCSVYTSLFAQIIGGNKNGTQVELDEKAAFDAQLQANRESARAQLKPYKYDGTKTTSFAYKTYTSSREVEVLTLEDVDYKLTFNANSVTKDRIIVRIYDGPETKKGRVLLYEKAEVGGNEFTVNTDELNKVLRTEYSKTLGQPTADKMRLKKLYISYIIPAVDKEVQTEQISKNKTLTTTVVTFNAIVVAVGYKTL